MLYPLSYEGGVVTLDGRLGSPKAVRVPVEAEVAPTGAGRAGRGR